MSASMPRPKRRTNRMHDVIYINDLSAPQSSIGARLETHDHGKTWVRHITTTVSLAYSSVEAAIEELQKASAGLTNTGLDIEIVSDYGSDRIECQVTGFRPATEEEVTWLWTEADKRANVERENDERLAANLKAQTEALKERRPDLFKDEA